MKAVVAAFNQEKALVGAFSVIVKTDCETDGSFYSTTPPPSTLHFTQDVEKIKLQPSKTLHGQGAAPASSQLGGVSGQD